MQPQILPMPGGGGCSRENMLRSGRPRWRQDLMCCGYTASLLKSLRDGLLKRVVRLSRLVPPLVLPTEHQAAADRRRRCHQEVRCRGGGPQKADRHAGCGGREWPVGGAGQPCDSHQRSACARSCLFLTGQGLSVGSQSLAGPLAGYALPCRAGPALPRPRFQSTPAWPPCRSSPLSWTTSSPAPATTCAPLWPRRWRA